AAPIPTGPPRGTDTAVSAVDPPQEMPPVHNVPGHRLVDRPLSVPRNGQVGADRDVLVWPELHDLAVERAANVLHTFASHTSQDRGNRPPVSVTRRHPPLPLGEKSAFRGGAVPRSTRPGTPSRSGGPPLPRRSIHHRTLRGICLKSPGG